MRPYSGLISSSPSSLSDMALILALTSPTSSLILTVTSFTSSFSLASTLFPSYLCSRLARQCKVSFYNSHARAISFNVRGASPEMILEESRRLLPLGAFRATKPVSFHLATHLDCGSEHKSFNYEQHTRLTVLARVPRNGPRDIFRFSCQDSVEFLEVL